MNERCIALAIWLNDFLVFTEAGSYEHLPCLAYRFICNLEVAIKDKENCFSSLQPLS